MQQLQEDHTRDTEQLQSKFRQELQAKDSELCGVQQQLAKMLLESVLNVELVSSTLW